MPTKAEQKMMLEVAKQHAAATEVIAEALRELHHFTAGREKVIAEAILARLASKGFVLEEME